jgi:hypothetical protein
MTSEKYRVFFYYFYFLFYYIFLIIILREISNFDLQRVRNYGFDPPTFIISKNDLQERNFTHSFRYSSFIIHLYTYLIFIFNIHIHSISIFIQYPYSFDTYIQYLYSVSIFVPTRILDNSSPQ